MRASTFFALFIALILGFGALAAARYFGVFRAATPVVERKVEIPKVLVAKKNLYKDYAMTPSDVMVRELTPYEINEYQEDPSKFLPPTTEAASLRILNRNINANQILLREHLEPQVIPGGPSQVVGPGMRAVHVSVPRDRASGGLIRVGDNVDVLITCKITGNGVEAVKIASLAMGVPVIFKRDLLYPLLLPVSDDKPLQFTLEANPYRASLIEFASSRGQLTLIPTSAVPRNKDEKVDGPRTFNNPASIEYRNEDERIAALLRGDRSIGDGDLERVFNLPPLPIRENVQVTMMKGSKIIEPSKGAGQFTRYVDPSERGPIDPDQPGYGYHFSLPYATGADQTPPAPARPTASVIQTRPQAPVAGKK